MTPDGQLIQVIQRLSFCRDMETVLSVLRVAARDLTAADGVTVVLREGDRCHYVEENAIAPLWKGRRFPMSACISGWCMLHREQVAIADVYGDPRVPQDAYRPTFVQSLAMTPIRSEEPIGAIGAYWAGHHHATPEELGVLQALGDAASIAISNVRLIEQLRTANRRKDEFLSMLAHELRAPLGPVRNALHILRIRPADSETGARARDMIDRQVGNLARIVDDLLEAARLQTGRTVLRTERIDLGRIARQAAEDRRGVLLDRGISLDVEAPEIPVWVKGDPARLPQAVDHLLDNAGKFTPREGHVGVKVTADPAAGVAMLTVRDSGIGIEPRELAEIFEPFTQADRSLDRSAGGLGLGLSVVKGLVELHGGSVRAESEGAGRGSAFTIVLSLEEELPALAGGSVGTAATSAHPRVLVVEDNRDAAESLKLLLEASGYEVSVAYTGPDGLEAARSGRPDVVLCDIGLPGMDGFQVAGALRRDAGTNRVRLIAVTGYGDPADRDRAFQAGFDLHFVKPVDPEALLECLSSAGDGPSR